jgi:hypothetical protein
MYENQLVNDKIKLMKEEIRDIATKEKLYYSPLKNKGEVNEKINHIKEEESCNILCIKESYNKITNLIEQSSYKTQHLNELEVFLTELNSVDPVSIYPVALGKLAKNTSNIQDDLNDIKANLDNAENNLKNAEAKRNELLKKEASIDKFANINDKASFTVTIPGNFKNITTDLINLELIKNAEPTVLNVKTKLSNFKSSIEYLLNNIVEKQINFSEMLVIKSNLNNFKGDYLLGSEWLSFLYNPKTVCLNAIKDLKTQNLDLFNLDFITACDIENNILPKEEVDNLISNINDTIKTIREFDIASLNAELGDQSEEKFTTIHTLAKSFQAQVVTNKNNLTSLLNKITNDISLLDDLPTVDILSLEFKDADKSASLKKQIDEDLKKVDDEIATLTQTKDAQSNKANLYTGVLKEIELLTSHLNNTDILVKRLENLDKVNKLVEELNNPESEINSFKKSTDDNLKSIYAQMTKLWNQIAGLKDTNSIYEHETINDLKEKLYGTVDGKEVGIIQRIEELKTLKSNSEEKLSYFTNNYDSYKKIEEEIKEEVYNGSQLKVNKLGKFLELIDDIEDKLINNTNDDGSIVGFVKYCYSVDFWTLSRFVCWLTNSRFTSSMTENKIEDYLADGFFTKNTLESEIHQLESLRIKLYGDLGKGIFLNDGKTTTSHTPVDSNDSNTETTGNDSTLFTDSHS